MKILVITAALFLVAFNGPFAKAEALKCGFSKLGRSADFETKTFYFPVERGNHSAKMAMVLDRRSYRGGALVSENIEAPIVVSKFVAGEEGKKTWILAGTGQLSFQPSSFKSARYYGTALYTAADGPEITEVLDDCFLDPAEVGFTGKN